jgi:hypothetical protein
MSTLLGNIFLTVDSKHIPPLGSISRELFTPLTVGVKRRHLAQINESYRGSALEDLEGEKYGFWLIDRYKDVDGDSCLILNYRHLEGNNGLDDEARKIRRKERAQYSLKGAQQGRRREPKAIAEVSAARKLFFLALGLAANDSDIKGKKSSKD